MANYSIKDLETLSGIKAHTIRIWEKRYELLSPARTDTNIRTYSDSDLKILLNVALLNKKGIKISHIADMSSYEICEKVENFSEQTVDTSVFVDRLIVDMIDLEEERLTERLEKTLEKYGVIHGFTKVVYPFLERIGVLWQIGSITPAQEHFVSHLLRNKLIAEIMGLNNNWEAKERYVLFLPAHEMHEIGLLLYYYILKSRGAYVMYLGQNVPYEDLDSVIKTTRATHTLSAYTGSTKTIDFKKYLKALSTDFPSITHYVTGFQVANYSGKTPSNVVSINSLEQFLS